jgi:hypothetical protein
MGGGGGAATRNDNSGNTSASSGAAGGAIVIIRAGILSGTGTITADGANAYNDTLNDGGGGGARAEAYWSGRWQAVSAA